jgi:hypothetical protein
MSGSAGFASLSAGHVPRAAAPRQSTALTLRPLLAPFKGRGRLFLRIEKMPQQASLSAGRRNSDGSWSLASDELEDLTYLVPSHAARDHVLAVRVTAVDGGEATTLKVLDFPVSFSAAPPANEAGRPAEQSGLPSQLAQMQSLLAAREAEIGELRAVVGQERLERERDAEHIREQLQSDFDQRMAKAAARHRQELEAERAALQAQIADLTARVPQPRERERDAELIRQGLQKDFDRRLDKAAARHQQELAAERAALQAQIADLAARVPQPRDKERDAELLRQRLQKEFDQRLETESAQHQRQLETQRAALQAEISALTARAAESERRLQEEQQSRDVYAQIEQELRATYEEQLKSAQRQLEEARRVSAADGEANQRSAQDRWNTELAIAVQQARESWDDEQAGLIAKLRDEHERHCNALLAAQSETIATLEAAVAKAAPQAGDHNAAALQSLNEQLAAAKRVLADCERELKDAKAQLEKERAANGQKADQLLQQERDNWQREEESLREQLSTARAEAEAQITCLAARCREAEGRVNRNSWGTAIQDKAHIDALNKEVASLRTALARQASAQAHDRPNGGFQTAASLEAPKETGRSKKALLRDFCIVVCCITPLILFYPRLASFVHDFMSDDPPASTVAAPPKPAALAAVAPARMATVLRGVNMRQQPATTAAVVVTLKKGAEVELLSASGKWTEVGVKGEGGAVTRGWVFNSYLRADP